MFNAWAKKHVEALLKKADININGNRPWDIQVHDERAFWRVLLSGSLGFGESYMDGWWETRDLNTCTAKLLSADLGEHFNMWLFIPLYLQALLLNRQTRQRSTTVAKEHYNLSPKLYESFLDPYNQYTCGYFKNTNDLNQAQVNKLDLICKKLQLKASDKVLDIGCGWGGFAKFAAERYGCAVTGISISDEQIAYAQAYTAGLPVTILKKDYRDLTGVYDKVLVCGMIEHVGYKNYRALMAVVRRVLVDNGLFLLHTIGCDFTTSHIDPWINKYIFPNAVIPSTRQLTSAFERLFVIEDWHNFGADYEKTLLAWLRNLDAHWHELKANYSERFYRMWKYYLLSSAGSFKSRTNQLWQIVLSPRGVPGGYQSIR